jgi:hypothetical protein
MQEPKKKDPNGVPILRYGPNNNFMRFQEALSKKALEDYGMLGKLILKGKIENPVEPDKADFDLNDEYDKVAYLEELKLYRKLKSEQKEKKPKLYATILKYLSEESLEAVRKANDWDKVEEDVDPERLWEIIVDKHRVHSTSEVAAIVKLEARNQLQNLRQGGFESVISYKQRYSNAIKAYHDQGNPTKDDADQAMDFFHGLDNGRYADFKVQYLNGLQVKSIKAPKDLNKIFTLANNWLKPKSIPGGGYASTYATRVDKVEKKREGGKQDGKGKSDKDETTKTQSENGTSDTKERDGKPKPKKNIECFTCGENHYASDCPHRKKVMSAKQQQEGQDDGNAFINAAWEANVYHTYQVNAVGMSGFSSTEVLLDNQADISIMRPELLRQLRPTNGMVRVNGVGGI